MIDEAPVHQAALCRHGLLTRTQLRKFGISPAMECRRVARGRCWAWLVVLRAVVDQRFEQPGTAGDMEFCSLRSLRARRFSRRPASGSSSGDGWTSCGMTRGSTATPPGNGLRLPQLGQQFLFQIPQRLGDGHVVRVRIDQPSNAGPEGGHVGPPAFRDHPKVCLLYTSPSPRD